MKVLISDKISESSLQLLKDGNIQFDYLPEITPQELLLTIKNYEALIVRSRTKVSREIINAGNNLKVMGRVGSGVDNIDLEAAKEKKIVVVNAPDANSQAVAELVLGLMLSLLRKIPSADFSMKKGLWLKKELAGRELAGKTVGIVGYGHIGKKLEKIVTAFGAKVLIHSRSFQTSSLEELFEKSDIITLHLALTKETKNLINKELLEKMKLTAYLINAARAAIIDEDDLFEILTKKKIAGCALDVFWQEPLDPESRWRKLDNIILMPHLGASTREALIKGSLTVVKDIVRVLKGEKPENIVV